MWRGPYAPSLGLGFRQGSYPFPGQFCLPPAPGGISGIPPNTPRQPFSLDLRISHGLPARHLGLPGAALGSVYTRPHPRPWLPPLKM